ncbi:hypothetical protein Hanom_Chr00s188514g01834061 [Helianthus anomalus]
MEPIKSNHLQNPSPPLDLAETKSRPFKLHFLTAISAVMSSFLVGSYLRKFRPHVLHIWLLQNWIVG